MSDPASGTVPPSDGTTAPQADHPADHRTPFPAVRLLYSLGFGIIAWFVFWITILVALVQFVVVAINGKVNDELRNFTVSLIQYLWELLAFITFVRDEQPFPIGQFPKHP